MPPANGMHINTNGRRASGLGGCDGAGQIAVNCKVGARRSANVLSCTGCRAFGRARGRRSAEKPYRDEHDTDLLQRMNAAIGKNEVPKQIGKARVQQAADLGTTSSKDG